MGRVRRAGAIAGLLVFSLAAHESGRAAGTANGSIEGLVSDLAGRPVAARLTVTPGQGGPSVHGACRADGTFLLAALPEGTYRLDVEVQGFDLTRLNHVEVRADLTTAVRATVQVSALCECVVSGLRSGVSVQGEVRDDRGRPLPHARLRLAHPGWVESTYADAEGRFVAHKPTRGAFRITATDSGFGTATAPLSRHTDAPIVITLRPIGLGGVPTTERFIHGCGCPDLVDVEGR